MSNFYRFTAENLRRLFRVGFRYKDQFGATFENCEYFGQEASSLIKAGLLSDRPFAVSRFGYSELRALLTYLHMTENTSKFQKGLSFVMGKKVEPWWSKNTVKIVTHNAGVFPAEIEIIERYCRLSLDDVPHIDVLGSWLGGEKWIRSMMPATRFIRFHDFYHFLHSDPWTSALEGKKVLVVHPFSKSIRHQYNQKNKIFSGVHTLPDFELITYKAVQSISGNRPPDFENWFQALDSMKADLSKIDFDVAILGCGAYGMPLAVFIKEILHRKAVHLGGNTQILFGITGSRWENDPKFSHIFNEHWIRPLSEETPSGHETIDGNCYW